MMHTNDAQHLNQEQWQLHPLSCPSQCLVILNCFCKSNRSTKQAHARGSTQERQDVCGVQSSAKLPDPTHLGASECFSGFTHPALLGLPINFPSQCR